MVLEQIQCCSYMHLVPLLRGWLAAFLYWYYPLIALCLTRVGMIFAAPQHWADWLLFSRVFCQPLQHCDRWVKNGAYFPHSCITVTVFFMWSHKFFQILGMQMDSVCFGSQFRVERHRYNQIGLNNAQLKGNTEEWTVLSVGAMRLRVSIQTSRSQAACKWNLKTSDLLMSDKMQ